MISNWISGNENLTFKLIFQLTRDKTSDAFHQLCGNEKIKKTMVVIKHLKEIYLEDIHLITGEEVSSLKIKQQYYSM